MSEEMEAILCEMISAAGAARSSYIEAIDIAISGKDNPEAAMEQGNTYFNQAHEFHHKLLAKEAESGAVATTLFLIHVEDQLMCAETFRILAQKLITICENK